MTDLLPSVDASTRTPNPASNGSEPTKEVQRTRLVVDTSVLIADPTCVLEFQDAHVIVPLTVVEELDGLKSRPDDVGRAARTALRTLEELRVALVDGQRLFDLDIESASFQVREDLMAHLPGCA